MFPPHLDLIIVPNDIAASQGHGTGLAKTCERTLGGPTPYIIVLCIHLRCDIFGSLRLWQ